MWGVWGNSLTHLVRLDKVTHVMQRAATGCRDWGRGDLDQTLRGVWAQVGSYWGDDGVEQSLVSVLSLVSVGHPRETRNREKNSDQSSPDISDDLFVSIFRKYGDKSNGYFVH